MNWLGWEGVAAVDDDDLAADHVGLRATEEDDGGGDVSRLDHAAGGGSRAGVSQHLVAVLKKLERIGVD